MPTDIEGASCSGDTLVVKAFESAHIWLPGKWSYKSFERDHWFVGADLIGVKPESGWRELHS